MEYRCVQSVFLACSIICLIPAAFTRKYKSILRLPNEYLSFSKFAKLNAR